MNRLPALNRFLSTLTQRTQGLREVTRSIHEFPLQSGLPWMHPNSALAEFGNLNMRAGSNRLASSPRMRA